MHGPALFWLALVCLLVGFGAGFLSGLLRAEQLIDAATREASAWQARAVAARRAALHLAARTDPNHRDHWRRPA